MNKLIAFAFYVFAFCSSLSTYASDAWQLRNNSAYQVGLGVSILTGHKAYSQKMVHYSIEAINSFDRTKLIESIEDLGLNIEINKDSNIIASLEKLKKGGLGLFETRVDTATDFNSPTSLDYSRWILVSYSQKGNAFVVNDYPEMGRPLTEISLIQRLNEAGLATSMLIQTDVSIGVDAKRNDNFVTAPPPIQGNSNGECIVVPKSVHAGGVIKLAQLISVRFSIENKGNVDIDLLGIKGSCSCVKRIEYESRVKVNKSVVITAYIDTAPYLRRDFFKTQLTVLSSDKQLPIALVDVNVDFDNSSYFFASPQQINLGFVDIHKTDKIEKTFDVYSKVLPSKESSFIAIAPSEGVTISPVKLTKIEKNGDFWLVSRFDVSLNLSPLKAGFQVLSFGLQRADNDKIILPCNIKLFVSRDGV